MNEPQRSVFQPCRRDGGIGWRVLVTWPTTGHSYPIGAFQRREEAERWIADNAERWLGDNREL
jgi:hypothetical protein